MRKANSDMPPIDKITHTLAGAAIAAALLPFGVTPALLAVLVAAVGKELWDARGHGGNDTGAVAHGENERDLMPPKTHKW